MLAALAAMTAFLPFPPVWGQERSAQADEARARAQEAQARAEAIRREAISRSGNVQKIIQVQHADVHALQAVFRNWVADIQASPELKLLTVVGEPEAVGRLQEAIQELDVPEKWSASGYEITRSFTIQNASTPQEVQEIATMIRGTGDIRRLFVANATNTVVIRGTPDQLALAEQIIKATDIPRSTRISGNVEIVVQLLEGTNQPSSELPKQLEATVRELKNTFPYQGYRVIETFVARVRVGEQSQVNGSIPDTTSPDMPSPVYYSFQTLAQGIVPKGTERIIQLNGLNLNLRVPVRTGSSGQFSYTEVGIKTELNIPEGKTVVVGKAGAGEKIHGLFVVLTARVVE